MGSALDALLEKPTDGGFADWFIDRHGNKVRFMPETGAWFIYTAGRWMRDDAGAIAELVKDASRALILLIPSEQSEARQSDMLKLAHKYDSHDRIRKVLEYAKSDPRLLMRLSECDGDPYLLNCSNGTVDLRDARLLVHSPSHKITKTTNIPFERRCTFPKGYGFLVAGDRQHLAITPHRPRPRANGVARHARRVAHQQRRAVGRANGREFAGVVAMSRIARTL